MKPQRALSRTEELGINDLTHQILKCAFKVHTALGPGLLESAYRACLQHELIKAAFFVETEVPLPIKYDGVALDAGYRLDLVVERRSHLGTEVRRGAERTSHCTIAVLSEAKRIARRALIELSCQAPEGWHEETGEW